MDAFQQFLIEKNACEIAQKWAIGKTIEQAIDECHKGGWLFWLAEKLSVDDRILVGAVAECAKTVRHLMVDQRCKTAIDVYIAYANGKATKDDYLTACANASWAARDAAQCGRMAELAAADAVCAADANPPKTTDICRNILKGPILEKWNQIKLA